MLRFAFHFNRLTGNKVEDMDANYILEKWYNYFGDSKPPIITKDFIDEYIVAKWCERWSNFDMVAGHIQLIQSIQKKMTPLLIIEMFKGTEWDDTHDFSYNGLHPKIRQVMDEWEHSHDDEMKYLLREIRINGLLDRS
jgi:hypothetical protein